MENPQNASEKICHSTPKTADLRLAYLVLFSWSIFAYLFAVLYPNLFHLRYTFVILSLPYIQEVLSNFQSLLIGQTVLRRQFFDKWYIYAWYIFNEIKKDKGIYNCNLRKVFLCMWINWSSRINSFMSILIFQKKSLEA